MKSHHFEYCCRVEEVYSWVGRCRLAGEHVLKIGYWPGTRYSAHNIFSTCKKKNFFFTLHSGSDVKKAAKWFRGHFS